MFVISRKGHAIIVSKQDSSKVGLSVSEHRSLAITNQENISRMNDADVYGGAVALGAASGLRTFAGPALVSQVAHSGLLPFEVPNLNFVKHRASAQSWFVLAIGELIADKLPSTPSRIAVGPLIGRALAGGFSGAAFSASKKRSAYVGALAGCFAAIGAAYAGYHLRRYLNKKLHIPDAIVALGEDAAVFACGAVVLNKLHAAREV
jgi:uncharacterized membrane protein